MIAYAATILLAALILWLTLTPVAVPGSGLVSDKLFHTLAFAALVMPTAMVVVPRALIITAPCALALGGAIELLQPLVGRERELLDVAADGVGVLAGMGVGLWLRRRVRDGADESGGRTMTHAAHPGRCAPLSDE